MFSQYPIMDDLANIHQRLIREELLYSIGLQISIFEFQPMLFKC